MGKVIMSGIVPQLKYVDSNIVCTLLDTNGNPVSGVMIDGIVDRNGNSVISNGSGIIKGFINEGSNTLSISGYADIEDFSTQVTLSSGEVLKKDITITTIDYLKITSAMSLKFSGNVETVDVALGGGGAGGSYGTGTYNHSTKSGAGGAGGGAGKVTVKTDIVPEYHTAYEAVVGAGGGEGVRGGATSFLGISAAGGIVKGGGAGGSYNPANGSKTAAKSGANGTDYLYASMSELLLYGGTGGGGAASAASNAGSVTGYGADGGTPGGGFGGHYNMPIAGRAGGAGVDGLGGGGGGAPNCLMYDSDSQYGYYWAAGYGPGKGGSGCITIRMHLKSAS